MEIRLQSDFRQEATIIVGQGANSTHFITLPIGLQAGKTRKLGTFPIDFADHYTLSITGGRVEQLGINQSSYTAEFEPIRGTISPRQLHLPFNGLELIFECDENWSGPKCDVACGSDCNTERQSLDMTVSTDYTVDLTKLPEIIKRLKETTKVDNEIKKKEEKVEAKEEQKEKGDTENLKRINQNGDSLGAKKERPSPKSVISDLLSSILSLKDRITRGESINEMPIVIDVKMDGDFDPTPESQPVEEMLMNPMSMIQKIVATRRGEEDHSDDIEKHSSLQKMLGLGEHRKPDRFSSWEGPGERMGGFNPMGSLMSMMMPRITRRHVNGKQPVEIVQSEGSGGPDDFDFDQIIKTRSQ